VHLWIRSTLFTTPGSNGFESNRLHSVMKTFCLMLLVGSTLISVLMRVACAVLRAVGLCAAVVVPVLVVAVCP
jgi:uncharacterized membrane protein